MTLNIYDLSPVNDAIVPFGLGVFHTGVQVGGREYTFAGGAGIFDHAPQEPGDNARFRESLDMGTFEGGEPAVNAALSALTPGFGPDGYNIMLSNCNHFSDALCRRLLGVPIPGYINRLANLGGCVAGCLPASLLEGTPVGGPGGSAGPPAGYSVVGGGQRRLGGGGSSSNSGAPAAAFSGSGMALGGGSTSSAPSSGGSMSGSELQDRREKTRQARLARLEKLES